MTINARLAAFVETHEHQLGIVLHGTRYLVARAHVDQAFREQLLPYSRKLFELPGDEDEDFTPEQAVEQISGLHAKASGTFVPRAANDPQISTTEFTDGAQALLLLLGFGQVLKTNAVFEDHGMEAALPGMSVADAVEFDDAIKTLMEPELSVVS